MSPRVQQHHDRCNQSQSRRTRRSVYGNTVLGQFYPRYGRRALRAFSVFDHGPGTMPKVHVERLFASSEGPTRTHSARVKVGDIYFLVVGRYVVNGGQDDVNDTISSIKPNPPWWGEVASFVFGKRGSLLAYPRAHVKTHNLAIRLSSGRSIRR